MNALPLDARCLPAGIAPQIVVPGVGADADSVAAVVREFPGTDVDPASVAEVRRGLGFAPDFAFDRTREEFGFVLYVTPPLLPWQSASGYYGDDDPPLFGTSAVVHVGPTRTAFVALHEWVHAYDDFLAGPRGDGIGDGTFFTDTSAAWQSAWSEAAPVVGGYGSGSTREGFAEWGAARLMFGESFTPAVDAFLDAVFVGAFVG